ncbi:heavy metal translocating P-type ATPase [Porticoccaceae bacterium]|nr:heavy metal translocating P-type ATPase [Porticoccaceae bacterium]
MTISAPANQFCYHCGLEVPQQGDFSLVIQGIRRAMCCPGCAAVAATIFENGLQSFYKFRSAPSSQIVENSYSEAQGNPYADWDLEEIQSEYVSHTDQGQLSIRLYIGNITCAACTWLIEQHVGKLPGIDRIAINGTTRRGEIIWTPETLSLSQILRAIKQIGYDASPINQHSTQSPATNESRKLLLRLGVAGLAMMQTGMVAIALYAGSFQGMQVEWQNLLRLISVLFVTPVVFYSAQPFFSSAWRSLKMHHLVMDVPVALAIALAYSASLWATLRGGGEVYFDSITMFSFFLLLGRFAEQRIRDKNLLLLNRGTLLPPVATQIFPQDEFSESKAETQVPIKMLSAGDFIRVNAGQIIPCDGVIEEGTSQISEAILTGESKPLTKQVGQTVYGGTVNGANPLMIKVSATGEATSLSSIIKLAERAALDKPQWAMLADRLAGYFIAVLLLIAAVVAIYWWLYEPGRALWITLSVLVVTCPCALSLATPTALTVASNILRTRGFLINRMHVLETLAAIDQVVFDKTGTLTEGNLKLVSVDISDTGADISEQQIVAWAALLERGSEHPIALALRNNSRLQSQMAATVIEQYFITGSGVRGRIGADTFYLGRPAWVCEMAELKELTVNHSENSRNQCIQIALARRGEWLGTLSFSDQLRPTAVAAVNQLRDRGLKVSLLSGDPSPGAAQIVKPLRLDAYQLSLQPQQKLAAVCDLQQHGKRVLMVGDGINDVPVLQAADVSVALGQASDLSQIHADVTLLSGDLRALPEAIATATQTRRIIKQNILWAIGYNLVALPLAAAGYVPPWAAAIGMSGSSLLVMLNALRLARGTKLE